MASSIADRRWQVRLVIAALTAMPIFLTKSLIYRALGIEWRCADSSPLGHGLCVAEYGWLGVAIGVGISVIMLGATLWLVERRLRFGMIVTIFIVVATLGMLVIEPPTLALVYILLAHGGMSRRPSSRQPVVTAPR